jgi:3-oxoacyl-[acyl-carrier-protein] synthase II
MERFIKQRRVVITGMGIICPTGNSVEEAWRNTAAGKSGIGPVTRFDASDLDVRFGGEVKNFQPEKLLGQRDMRRTDRVSQMALFAADEALRDSGLQITAENHYDIGCVVGTGIGGIESLVESVRMIVAKGVKALRPLALPMALPDSPCSQISMRFGLRGPVFDISTACATGNNCIGEATAIIRRGEATTILAGGSEAGLIDVSLAGFNNMTALSRRNDAPQKASRPFDIDRDGFVVGEGAGVLVLEDLEQAQARHAKIYAEVLGYGHTADAFHVTAPLETGESAARAIQRALKDAQLQPTNIDYINAHGTSTVLNDRSETLAIKAALGEHAYHLPISSTKSVTGHLMGAAGAVEAIFSIMALRHQFVPPTINLDHPDPDCDLNYTPHVGQPHPMQIVMSNSFGFGGHNAVVIFGQYRPDGEAG